MKNWVILFSLVFNISAFAQSDLISIPIDPVKQIIKTSSIHINSDETCDEVLSNHIAIVESSEKYIISLVSKKNIELSAHNINMLQKIMTNRFLHLQKAVNMYEEIDGVSLCAPTSLGTAIAIYDFVELGKQALKDTKLRRTILNFTNFPKYKLSKLKILYDHYTSDEVINDLLEEMREENVTLPPNLIIEQDASKGSFDDFSDIPLKGVVSVVSGAARVWGFISDHLKWRSGRLNKNAEALQLLKSKLKPLDLLFEKRTFTLSNYTIPGHWGHVAVWLGTKEELIAMGVWEEDFFKPFRRQVEDGKNIVEVRKKGINYPSLEEFLNLDEIAVTRVANAQQNPLEIFRELSEQLDKTYDFTFNIQNSDKLTCSELIAFTYGDIQWPETETLGQVSIKPDEIAIMTLYQNAPSEFVLFLKGKKNHSFEEKSFESWKKLFSKKLKKEVANK